MKKKMLGIFLAVTLSVGNLSGGIVTALAEEPQSQGTTIVEKGLSAETSGQTGELSETSEDTEVKKDEQTKDIGEDVAETDNTEPDNAEATETVIPQNQEKSESAVFQNQTEGEEAVAPHSAKTIYLNYQGGSDSADGMTESTAVRSLKRALEITDEGDTIMCGRVYLNCEGSITVKNRIFKRMDGYTGTVFAMKGLSRTGVDPDRTILTLTDCVVDGNKENVPDPAKEMDYGPLFSVQPGTVLNIEGTTKICNNGYAAILCGDMNEYEDNNTHHYGPLARSTVNMTGGEICGNGMLPDVDSYNKPYQADYEIRCGGAITVRKEADVNISGGSIHDNESEQGAAIFNEIGRSGKVNITGGEFYNNRALYGGAIANLGILNISSGNFHDNTAGDGGAVATLGNGITKITGGTFTSNRADRTVTIGSKTGASGTGGAIYQNSFHTSVTRYKDPETKEFAVNGYVYVLGGTYSGNSAEYGGAIAVKGNSNSTTLPGIDWYGTMNWGWWSWAEISGGVIRDNTATKGGQAIVLDLQDVSVGNGAYTNVLSLCGSPDIQGDIYLRDDKDNRAYIAVGTVSTADNTNAPYDSPNKGTKAEGTFTPAHPVTINDSSWTEGRRVLECAAGMNAAETAEKFVTVSADKLLKISGQEIQSTHTATTATVTYVTNSSTSIKPYKGKIGSAIPEVDRPKITWKGHVLTGWFTEPEFKNQWDFDSPVMKDITLYAKWELEKVDVIIAEKDGPEYVTIKVTPDNKISKDSIPEMNKPGYILDGWETADGTAWDLDKDTVKGSMTLHPVWKLDIPEAELHTEGNVTSVHAGQGLKLTATATHDALDGITYDFTWFKGGEEIKDANKANGIALAAVPGTSELTVTEAGDYSVKITASDGKLTSEAITCGPIGVTVTPHDFTGDWKKDGNSHWHACTENGCDVTQDMAAHTYGNWKVEKEATKTEDGVKVRSCDVCGYEERAVIPAQGEEPDKTISVNYQFVSGTEKKELPPEVLALLPKDSKGYAKGDKVAAIRPEKDRVTVAEGVWTFEGYDVDEKEAVAGITFTGTWKFTGNKPGTDDNNNNSNNNNNNSHNNQNRTDKNGNNSATRNTTVKHTENVKTGDVSQSGTWAILLVLSGMIAAVHAGWALKKRR